MSTADTLHSSLTLFSSHPLMERLFFASVEFAVLAALVYIAIRVGRIRSARLASLLWLIVLAKPIVSLAIGSPFPLVRMEVAPPATAAQAPADTTQRADRPLPGATRTLPFPENPDEPTAPQLAERPPRTISRPATSNPMLPPVDSAAPVAAQPVAPFLPTSLATAILTTWLGGVAFFAGLSLRDRVRLRRLVRGARRPDPWLSDRYCVIVGQLGLRWPLELRITDTIEGPALVGSVFNTVLIPAWLADESNGPKLDWALRHELMHWKLRDPWASLVRELAQILFYFHPIAWWAGRQWKAATERACDRAIVMNDAESLDYAEQLYGIVVGIRSRTQVPLRNGLFATRTQVGQRIAALLNGPRTAPHLSAFAIAGLTVVTAVALCVGGTFADKTPRRSPEETHLTAASAPTTRTADTIGKALADASRETEPDLSAKVGDQVTQARVPAIASDANPNAGSANTLKNILAAMRQREKAIRSFELKWRTHLTMDGRFSDRIATSAEVPRGPEAGAPFVGGWPVHRLLMTGSRFRSETTSISFLKTSAGKEHPYVEVCNGQVHQQYQPGDGVAYSAVMRDATAAEMLSHVNLIGPALVFRPMSQPVIPLQSESVVLEGKESETSGRPCVVLKIRDTRSPDAGEWRCFLDRERGFVPVRLQERRRGHLATEISVPQFTVDPQYGPVPAMWMTTLYRADGSIFHAYFNVVDEYHLNRKIPDSEFELKLPPGTKVIGDIR